MSRLSRPGGLRSPPPHRAASPLGDDRRRYHLPATGGPWPTGRRCPWPPTCWLALAGADRGSSPISPSPVTTSSRPELLLSQLRGWLYLMPALPPAPLPRGAVVSTPPAPRPASPTSGCDPTPIEGHEPHQPEGDAGVSGSPDPGARRLVTLAAGLASAAVLTAACSSGTSSAPPPIPSPPGPSI